MNKLSYHNRKKSTERKIDSPVYTLDLPALRYTVMLCKTMKLRASRKLEAARQLEEIRQMNINNHQMLCQQQEDKDKWKKDEVDEVDVAQCWKEEEKAAKVAMS